MCGSGVGESFEDFLLENQKTNVTCVRQDTSGSLSGGSLCGVSSGASEFPAGSVSQTKTLWWVPTDTEKQLQLMENYLCGSAQSPYQGGAKPSCNHWLTHNFLLLAMTFQCFQKSPGHCSSHMQSMYIVSVFHCMHVHSSAFSVTHTSQVILVPCLYLPH